MTEFKLVLDGSNPAHYLALLGMIRLSNHNLKLHFDGLEPVITAADDITAEQVAIDITETIITLASGALSTLVGSSTTPLTTYEGFVQGGWDDPAATLPFDMMADFGSSDPNRPSKHFLYFGSGQTSVRTAIAHVLTSDRWNTVFTDRKKGDSLPDLVRMFFIGDICGMLNEELPLPVLRPSILWFSTTGLESKPQGGLTDGYVDATLEALAVGAFLTVNPVGLPRNRTPGHKADFTWCLNTVPASISTLTALQRLDPKRYPAGLHAFRAAITGLRTDDKSARFTDNPVNLGRAAA